MNSKELGAYLWLAYIESGNVEEFVERVNHQTTFHDSRVIEAVYYVIDYAANDYLTPSVP